jgi:hypothetical protein
MSKWSEWRDILSIKDFAKDIGKSPGVYEIRLSNSAGHPTSIDRLLGTDEAGLLAIGESVNLARRIKEFYDSYTGQRFYHCTGDRLFLVWASHYTDWRYSKDNSRVQVRVMKLQNKAEAEREEEHLLKKYFREYGELPPLNSSMPDKHICWDEIIKM